MIELYPDLYKVTMLGDELLNVLTQQMCISFRRDVFKHYKKCYTARLPVSLHDFVSEYIHNNVNILIPVSYTHLTLPTMAHV